MHLFLRYLIIKGCIQFHQELFSLWEYSTAKALWYMGDVLLPLEIHYSFQEATTIRRETIRTKTTDNLFHISTQEDEMVTMRKVIIS